MRLTDQEMLALLELPEKMGVAASEAEIELSPEEARFQEESRSCLGGTAVAAICGLSSYRNAWDVAAEHKGILPPFRGTERTRWGQILEEPILREYARRTGHDVQKGTFVRDPDVFHFGGHLDGAAPASRKVVEVKTVEFGREKWSNPGQPVRVPPDYFVQGQWYCGVTRYDTVDLVAMFGLSTMRWYELQRNDRIISALRERAEAFHERYILGNELPPMEPSDRAVAWLKAKYPNQITDTFVVANEEQTEAIQQWMENKSQREAYLKEEEKWKLHVQLAIGDATGIVSDAGTITWKKDRDTVKVATDWESLMLAYAERHGFQIDAADIQKFTKSVVTREGARKLLLKKKG